MGPGKSLLGCIWILVWGAWLLLFSWYCVGFIKPTLRIEGAWVLPALLILSVLILVRVITSRRSEDTERQNEGAGQERRLSLLGSFIVGITPLGITAIAAATSVADVRETFRSESPAIDLAPYNEMRPTDVKFFIGVDVSQSVLRKDTDTRAQVCEVLRRMLARPEAIGWKAPAIPPTAAAEIWQFGTTPVRVERHDPGRFADPWIAGLADALCQHLEDIVANPSPQSLRTDVLGLLEAIGSGIESSLMKGERVVVILISDLLQDAGESGYQVEERLRGLVMRFHEAHNYGNQATSSATGSSGASAFSADDGFAKRLAIVGLTVVSAGGRSRPDTRTVDLQPLLEQWLPEHFQSIPLTDLLGLYSPHDAMHLIGATSAEIQINVGHPLFLKYRADGADRRNSLRAEILHALPPPDADGQRPSVIAVQLRAYPDRGSLPQTVQMRYVLDGQGSPPSLLTSSAGRRNTWNLEQVDVGQEGAIQVWLASSLDLSRSSRLELLLAVPERGVVYAIPVTIMPVLEGDALTVFKWLTWFFAACGVCLVLSHAWSSRRTVWSELDPIGRWRTLIGKAAGRAATALSRVRDRFSAPPSPAPHGDDKPAAGGPT
jgi:hypothetical protein